MKVGFDSKIFQTCMRKGENKTQVGEKTEAFIILYIKWKMFEDQKIWKMKIGEFCW